MRRLTSIIIVSYNTCELTISCIESIRCYTKEGTYELIVVDNASIDDSVARLQQEADVRLVVNKENRGFPTACNQGMQLARGTELLLLNSDTVVTYNWLDNMLKALYSKEKIGAVGCVTNACSNWQQIPVDYKNLKEMQNFAKSFNNSDPAKWHPWQMLVGYCLLLKHEVFVQIGMLDDKFNPGNYEDDDYCLRIRLAGYELLLCADTFIHHYGSASFIYGINAEEKKAREKKFEIINARNKVYFCKKWQLAIDAYRVVHSGVIALATEIPRNAKVLLNAEGYAGDWYYLHYKRPDITLFGITDNKVVADALSQSFPMMLTNDIKRALPQIAGDYDYVVVNGRIYSYGNVTVTLLYIVKNEEKNLAKSIESFQGEYDELVVVDTGSNDETVNVAKKYGAKVEHYIWNSDFSAARNYALAQANGDWVIFPDADQYYTGTIKIRHVCESTGIECDGLNVAIYNEGRENLPPSRELKIFRNDGKLFYENKIHEILKRKDGKPLKLNYHKDIVFMHSGYSNELLPKKIRRNLAILESDIQSNGLQEKHYFYLADCYFILGDFKNAMLYAEKAINSCVTYFDYDAKMHLVLIESMRQCNISLTKMLEAIDRAIGLYPDMPEFYGEKGMVLSSQGDWHNSLAAFVRCVELYNSATRKEQPYGVANSSSIRQVYTRMANICRTIGEMDLAEELEKERLRLE